MQVLKKWTNLLQAWKKFSRISKKVMFNLVSEKDTLCWSFGAIQQGSRSPRKFCDFFRFGVLYVMKVQLNCDTLQDQGEDERVVLVIITFINSRRALTT